LNEALFNKLYLGISGRLVDFGRLSIHKKCRKREEKSGLSLRAWWSQLDICSRLLIYRSVGKGKTYKTGIEKSHEGYYVVL